MSIEQAKELKESWDLELCDIEIGEEFHEDADAKMVLDTMENVFTKEKDDDEK
jgi:hypothetical protein